MFRFIALALLASLICAQAARIDTSAAHIMAEEPQTGAAAPQKDDAYIYEPVTASGRLVESRAVPDAAADADAAAGASRAAGAPLPGAGRPITRSGRLVEKDISAGLPNHLKAAGGDVPLVDPPKRVAGYFRSVS
jgi:hypothetical protein